jgi:ABC-type multidrug transport system ATPase subunit
MNDCRRFAVLMQTGTKVILDGINGSAKAGRLLGIIGPSGSGKSTLLQALCGQVSATKGMTLRGRVQHSSPVENVAFVRQNEQFYSQLTVRETVTMAAQLRLPGSMTLEEKLQQVDTLLLQLGLSQAADTIMGDDKTRGVSGGEARRVAIACEMLGSPSVVLCDEITTGLDAFQAQKVMAALQTLAREGGHTVICVIHQPRGSIVDMIDDLVVLSGGRAVYTGPTEDVVKYMTSALDMKAPSKHSNAAEIAIDLVSIDYTSPEAEAASKHRLDQLYAAHAKTAAADKGTAALITNGGGSSAVHKTASNRVSIVTQFKLLFQRSWRQINRSLPVSAMHS